MSLPYHISSKIREDIREIKVILAKEQIFFKVLHIFSWRRLISLDYVFISHMENYDSW